MAKSGRRIYLHAEHNMDGKVPLVLACLLVQKGESAKHALLRVNEFWLRTMHFLIRSPLTDEQLMFIKGWRK